MKKLIQNFIYCGTLGWCMEIIFTSFHSFRRRQLHLPASTSVWMFPIYGLAAFIGPLYKKLKTKHFIVRGLIYAGLIFTGEYVTGRILMRRELCPWNYEKSKWHVNKVIRLDYLPYWVAAGLLFERLIRDNDA